MQKMLSVKEINLLQAQNEGYRKQNESLQKENDHWQQLYQNEHCDLLKFKNCLQKIKAIVCSNYEIIDTQGRKDILKLITKMEEE